MIRLLSGITGAGNVKADEEMREHTSFKVGGPADLFIIPENRKGLVEVYRQCLKLNVPVFIFGNGTNLIVRDKGIRGVVIKILDNFSDYTVTGGVIAAGAGILLGRLSKIALENSLAGMEFAEGIPGTLGGAVAMNAGAYTGEMSNVITRTEYLDKNGNITMLVGDEHKFGKRTSYILSDGGIVLSSEIKLETGDPGEISRKMDDFKKQRKEKQPLEMPSAGSIFKRPDGYYAGKLIQDCGLGGFGIGGAEVSSKHCGFIINKGNATAGDVISLIKYIQNSVKGKYGVELLTEVKIVGEE
ncbi:MAG: UDP-N-acetylmuramate dehydrogenase [Ruminiclostridium sp.]|nr:UDP-N-acetylmuramate dehydrogenase [Ruminiclostridium sp.]